MWECERLWFYLLGKPVILLTDKRAVQLIFSNTTMIPSTRIERIALRLSQFNCILLRGKRIIIHHVLRDRVVEFVHEEHQDIVKQIFDKIKNLFSWNRQDGRGKG